MLVDVRSHGTVALNSFYALYLQALMKALTDVIHSLPDSTPPQNPHLLYSDIGLLDADINSLRCTLISVLQTSSTSDCDCLSVGARALSSSATKLVALASAGMSSYAAGQDMLAGHGALHALTYAETVGESTPHMHQQPDLPDVLMPLRCFDTVAQ